MIRQLAQAEEAGHFFSGPWGLPCSHLAPLTIPSLTFTVADPLPPPQCVWLLETPSCTAPRGRSQGGGMSRFGGIDVSSHHP